MGDAYAWCADCGRFVGQACCWGPGPTCAACTESRAASGDADSAFAVLAAARAAVRQMGGTATMFRAVEDAIAETYDGDHAAALAAWEASWLAATALRIRIEGSRAAAMSWLRAVPPRERDRAADVETELIMVSTSLDARWQSLVQSMASAGTGLASRMAEQDGPIDAARDSTAAAPVAADVPVAVDAPGSVAIPVPAPGHEPTSNPNPRPSTATTSLAPSDATRIASASAAGQVTPPAPLPGTLSRPSSPPVTRPAAERQPTDDRGSAMPAADEQGPAASYGGGRRAGIVLAAVVVLCVVALTGALLAGTIGPLARDSDGISVARNGASAKPSRIESIAASPSIGAGVSLSTLIAVDVHRIGPLDLEEVPITRVTGAPEVVAFPTPFDRSIRLSGTASGFCTEATPPSEGAASAAFDVHLGSVGSGGSLTISLSPVAGRPPTGLRIDLALLGELDDEAWYRLTLIARDDPPSRVEIVDLGTGGPVLELELESDRTVPTSSREVCVQSSLDDPQAALFIDNLRIDR